MSPWSSRRALTFDRRSIAGFTTQEVCVMPNAVAGVYTITVEGVADFAGVTLSASF